MTALGLATRRSAQRRTGSSRAPLRRILAALAALAAAVGAVLPAGVAAADTDDPSQGGLWYVEAMHLDEVHAEATGAGMTVAVIDTPINPDVPDLAGADLTVAPDNYCQSGLPVTSTGPDAEHGTNMATRIVGTDSGVGDQPGIPGVAPDARILYYTGSSGDGETECDSALFAEAIREAVAAGAQIISMSTVRPFDAAIPDAMAEAQRAGVVLVAAVSNEGTLTAADWPAYGNGIIAVEEGDVTASVPPPRLASPLLTLVAPGTQLRAIYTDGATGEWTHYALASGTSQATAVTAGALAVAWSAHPDSTANQMIQALVRNTGTEPKPDGLARDDDTGYGFLSLPRTLASDPSTYPDENPLVRDDADALPARAEIEGDATASAPPSGEAGGEATDAEPAADDAGSSVTILLVVLAVVVVAGIVGLVVALARRRTR